MNDPCRLELRGLSGSEPCGACNQPARDHRGHREYVEPTDREGGVMSEPPMSLRDLKRGDPCVAIYANSRGDEIRLGIVKSIGPKWITVGGSRYCCDSGTGDFGWSLYASIEAYEHRKARSAAWSRLRHIVDRYHPPADIQLASIEHATAILGGPL